MNKKNSSEHPINLYGQCYVYKGHILDMIDWHLWIAKKYTNITPGQEKSIEVCRSQTMHEIIEYIDSHKNQKTHQGPMKNFLIHKLFQFFMK